jgi:nucleoside-diphosphate-sugar epimerase
MKVCVLGSRGFIGSNLVRAHPDWTGCTIDLTVQKDVDDFFERNRFDAVVHCAVIGGSRLKEDSGDVCYKNLLMFENVVRNRDKFGTLVYFSSGASRRGDPPTDPYGFSKWLIDRRIETVPNAYSLCIWGCYGPGEWPTRFSAVCKAKGHVVIPQDKYFDFISVEEVAEVVHRYCLEGGAKMYDLVPTEKLKLSEWATRFGATFTIEREGIGEPYISQSTTDVRLQRRSDRSGPEDAPDQHPQHRSHD